MRILLVLTVVFSGCASLAQVRATSNETGGVQFSFDVRGQPVRVGGIDVYEEDGGHRGKTVCKLERTSPWRDDEMGLRSWVYGKDAGSNYVARDCSSLARGRNYGVNIFHFNCMSFTRFRVTADGTVVNLGPSDGSCYM